MKTILKLIIVTILLLEARLFYLLPLPQIIDKYNNYTNKEIILLITVVSITFLALHNFKRCFKGRIFNKYIVFILILYIVQVISSSFTYLQDVETTALAGHFFLLILLYYIISFFLLEERDYDFLIKSIIIISVILEIVFILQTLLYDSGYYFLNISEITNSGIQMRNGTIRLGYPSTLIGFSMILSFAEIIKEKFYIKKMIYYVNISLGAVYILVISQTRVLTISLVIAMIMMSLFMRVRNINKKIISMFFLIICIAFLFNLDFTQNYIKSFTSKEEIGSVEAREEAIEYFSSKIKENPITPIGFLNAPIDSSNYYILHGPEGTAYITDVGILGATAQLGICGLVWYIVLIVKMLFVMYKIKDKNNLNKNIQLIGFITFLILTSPTLIVINPERIIILPIIMSIFEYSYRQTLNK